MKAWGNYECEGQMSIFDVYGQDIWYGKTYPEHSVQTKEKISDASLKKFAELRIKPPMYLCLKRENGQPADASWEMVGQLLGEYTMHSFGECPREENVSRLSQILEVNPLPKYSLSPKACQGILRRAENRGKELPPQLKEALIRQSAFKNEPDVVGGGKGILIQHERTGALSTLNNQSVLSIDEKMGQTYVSEEMDNTLGARDYKQPQAVCYGFDAHNITATGGQSQTLTSGRNDTHSIPTVYGISGYESNAMKSSNPHSGIYEAETTRTLDLNGGNPACNQGGMMVVQGADMYNQMLTGEKTMSITGAATDPHHIPCAVCYSQDAYDKYTENDKCASLKASGGVYGGGERSNSYTTNETIGALCARDFKGVGSQYVDEGKCIVQSLGKSSG